MKQYKGFYIPRADLERVKLRKEIHEYADSHVREACYVAKKSDCDTTGKNRNDCFACLFGDIEKEQIEAFDEWFKAKGKVQYDN